MKTNIYSIFVLFAICFLSISCKKGTIEHKERRLTEFLRVESQWKMELKYSSSGKLVSTMPNGGDTLLYDNLGRLIKYRDSYATYAFDYSTNGHIKRKIPISTTSFNYHPDTIEYRYDAMGRVEQSISTFNDEYNIPRQGWIRKYSYNERNDIVDYNAIHPYYNQTERETLSYDKGENPLKLSNSILFYLNEYFYEALNQHNPIRKDNKDFISTYLYDYSSGTMPNHQTIKFYPPGQKVDPFGYNSLREVKFSYQ
jgi:YD repeat-containing protein